MSIGLSPKVVREWWLDWFMAQERPLLLPSLTPSMVSDGFVMVLVPSWLFYVKRSAIQMVLALNIPSTGRMVVRRLRLLSRFGFVVFLRSDTKG